MSRRPLPPSRRAPRSQHASPASQLSQASLQTLQQAAKAYSARQWDQAEQLCRGLIHKDPDCFDALNLLALIAAQTRRPVEAAELMRRLVTLRPNDASLHNNYGIVLRELKRHDEALQRYAQALILKPDYAEAHNNRGVSLQEQTRTEEALQSYERAIALNANYVEAHFNRANLLRDLARYEEALEGYARALALKPDYAEAHNNRGNALQKLLRFEEALSSFDRVLQLRPQHAEAHANRGVILHKLQRPEQALPSYERALQIDPDSAAAHHGMGVTLHDLKRFDGALASFSRALELKPDFAEVYNHRALLLQEMQRHEEALADFVRAQSIDADYVEASHNRALLLHELKRYDEALEGLERALRIRPDAPWLYGTWLHAKMKLCDWSNWPSDLEFMLDGIKAGKQISPPFVAVTMVDSCEIQRQAAQIWVQHCCPADSTLAPLGKRARGAKIRLGYYSADFYNHATAILSAQLFERHDRQRFELVALSFGPDQQDDMRRRLSAAFDQFIDVGSQSALEIAQLSRELGIDIAVDMKGFTQGQRPAIFAQRAAPIQVNYLGYPGTLGAGFMDYLIADAVLIPEHSRGLYAEKIVYLPDSYQVNDRLRPIAAQLPTRAQLGLPTDAFVFCCFNNSYKITPPTFDSWMRILGAVEPSVLWLLQDTESSSRHLREQAERRGVRGERLIFAGRASVADHLARQQVADLFLDTLPCNAHTTASDALWVGLPVLTQIGQSFVARVAASLLHAVGLPQLVVEDAQRYEARAIELARDPARLAALKQHLQQQRSEAPLFDIERYTRHLEQGYVQMYERYQSDLPPDHILVPP